MTKISRRDTLGLLAASAAALLPTEAPAPAGG
jgi:hypothetical protein